MRGQKYCSTRCKNSDRRRAETRRRYSDTCPHATPHKNINNRNALEAPESKSNLIRNAVQTEFFARRHWQRAVSDDGVEVLVARFKSPRHADSDSSTP
jgi:hypothetical protein